MRRIHSEERRKRSWKKTRYATIKRQKEEKKAAREAMKQKKREEEHRRLTGGVTAGQAGTSNLGAKDYAAEQKMVPVTGTAHTEEQGSQTIHVNHLNGNNLNSPRDEGSAETTMKVEAATDMSDQDYNPDLESDRGDTDDEDVEWNFVLPENPDPNIDISRTKIEPTDHEEESETDGGNTDLGETTNNEDEDEEDEKTSMARLVALSKMEPPTAQEACPNLDLNAAAGSSQQLVSIQEAVETIGERHSQVQADPIKSDESTNPIGIITGSHETINMEDAMSFISGPCDNL